MVTVNTIPLENAEPPLVMEPFSSARIALSPKTGTHIRTITIM